MLCLGIRSSSRKQKDAPSSKILQSECCQCALNDLIPGASPWKEKIVWCTLCWEMLSFKYVSLQILGEKIPRKGECCLFLTSVFSQHLVQFVLHLNEKIHFAVRLQQCWNFISLKSGKQQTRENRSLFSIRRFIWCLTVGDTSVFP